ncbi:NUDIX domain-containing protein [Candidatus Shapirobacteria bacterium]|nr:NUDIX domain-containing protein [Candidatus Shapirobacteria bacterium]
MEPTKKIKREFSSGGIVFREEPEGILWLVIKPTGNEKWRLPKGEIDKGESSGQSAIREVKEEAGVEAEILGKIGSEKFFFVWDKQKILKTVVFYLMKYLQEAQTGFGFETEAIDWLEFKEAQKRLAFDQEKELLGKAEKLRQEIGNIEQGELFKK